MVGRRPSSSPRGPRRGWLSVLQQDSRCPPEQAVALGLAEGGGDRGGKIEALAQVSQFGMWCLSFQGPAMRAPRDATEGSGVSAGKEDSGMVPLGEQLTPFPAPLSSPCPRGVPLLPVLHLFSDRPWHPSCVSGPVLGTRAGDGSDIPLPWRAQRVGVRQDSEPPVSIPAAGVCQVSEIPRQPFEICAIVMALALPSLRCEAEMTCSTRARHPGREQQVLAVAILIRPVQVRNKTKGCLSPCSSIGQFEDLGKGDTWFSSPASLPIPTPPPTRWSAWVPTQVPAPWYIIQSTCPPPPHSPISLPSCASIYRPPPYALPHPPAIPPTSIYWALTVHQGLCCTGDTGTKKKPTVNPLPIPMVSWR